MLKGPTGMGAAWLMEQDELGLTLNDYNFTVAGAADELTGQLIQGGLDIAALPTNAISALYNKTEGKIVCLGVNTLGVLYILENGESISSIEDLNGKTILASGKGSTAESVLIHLIAKSGIGADILSGKATLESLEKYALERGEVVDVVESGRQEYLENVLNAVMFG
jgi:NitT/TauT family transport system substrate-binding protein